MYIEMSFDTHKHIKEFVKAGMPEPQAEAIVELVLKSRDYDLSKLATRDQVTLVSHKIESSRVEFKSDIDRLEQKIESSRVEFKSDIDRLEQKIESSVKELEQKIEFSVKELEQKIIHIEEKMATKEDLFKLENQFITMFKSLENQMARFETQIARQDSQQKSWMMGMFLSMAAMAVTLILKLH